MADRVVVVTSPDDKVEGFTKERKNLPSLRFVYKPLSSAKHARYLDELARAGKSLARNQKVNYQMLSEQVVDAEFYDSAGEKLNFSDPAAWENVRAEIIMDVAMVIAGLDEDMQEREEKELTDL